MPLGRSKLPSLLLGQTHIMDPLRYTEKDITSSPVIFLPPKSVSKSKHETPDKLKFRDRLPNNWLVPLNVKVKKERLRNCSKLKRLNRHDT